jgi:N utilization substance protein B
MNEKRHLSRIIAMQTLFALQFSSEKNIQKQMEKALSLAETPLEDIQFSEKLIQGVLQHQEEILPLLSKHTKDKSLDKLDTLSLSILLLGTYELLFDENKQPMPVILNEAIELAKEYGKESSPALINAILSKISLEKR